MIHTKELVLIAVTFLRSFTLSMGNNVDVDCILLLVSTTDQSILAELFTSQLSHVVSQHQEVLPLQQILQTDTRIRSHIHVILDISTFQEIWKGLAR